MSVDRELVKRIAGLAKLELTEDEEARFTQDLKGIISSFEALDEIDVEGIEPSFRPLDEPDQMRDDVPHEPLSQEAALSFTKHKQDGHFIGPKTL